MCCFDSLLKTVRFEKIKKLLTEIKIVIKIILRLVNGVGGKND
jgi:hypothetical protein